MFKKIVWANDSSWQAQHAMPLVKELAADGGANLVVVYAQEGGVMGKLFVEKGEQTTPQILGHTVEELQRAGLDAELVVVRSGAGGQAQAIADVAREIGADLIVAGNAGHGAVVALEDRDRRVLAEIARQVRVDDPEFAAALTGASSRPRPVWTPIHLRVLAILLLAAGVLTSVTPLVLAGFVIYGIAQLYQMPCPHRSTTAGRDDQRPPSACP
jgi:nucleotide-binding universal stress UspA family protein